MGGQLPLSTTLRWGLTAPAHLNPIAQPWSGNAVPADLIDPDRYSENDRRLSDSGTPGLDWQKPELAWEIPAEDTVEGLEKLY